MVATCDSLALASPQPASRHSDLPASLAVCDRNMTRQSAHLKAHIDRNTGKLIKKKYQQKVKVGTEDGPVRNIIFIILSLSGREMLKVRIPGKNQADVEDALSV